MSRPLAAAILCLASLLPAAAPAAQDGVELTWMSIANWYFKVGDKKIMMDAYIARLPGPPFFYAPPNLPGDQYAYTQKGAAVDTDSVKKVRDAVLGSSKLDYLLVGHSHWDHSWDSPTWAKLTGDRSAGAKGKAARTRGAGRKAKGRAKRGFGR